MENTVQHANPKNPRNTVQDGVSAQNTEGSLVNPVSDQRLKAAKILIVDDHEANVALLEGYLEELGGYTSVRSTTDPRTIFMRYAEQEPDLILLDLHMPELDGFEVLRQLRLIVPGESYLPVLVLTADITSETKRRALEAGAKDFLTKPFDPTEVLLRIRNLLETRFLHAHLADLVHERTAQLEAAQAEILERLAVSAEYRDDMTGEHTRRVGDLAARIAAYLGLPPDEVALIREAGPLHDVGKIGIPDTILLKPGRITPEEFEQMKTHTTIGAKILSSGHSALVRLAEVIALSHHERWDGTGYPLGLSAEAISLPARIVAVADVFDALTHERPYKEAWPVAKAVAEIRAQAGRQFDPRVVEAFLSLPDALDWEA